MTKSLTNATAGAVRLLCLAAMMATPSTFGFQFMSNFKMPTYDPNQEAVQERFGDKSMYYFYHCY